MIPNVKKEMFLALVPVLQRNRHPRTFKMKSNLKHSLFTQILPWEKNCQERPHLLSGRFTKVFYKMTICFGRPLLSGSKSGRLMQV